MSPQPNTVLGAQSPYTFSFEVTQWDGGMWPGDVPLSMDEGMLGPNPSRLTRKSVTFEADVTLANRAGAQSVVAGWLEVDAGITVMAKKCDVNCRPWEECVPNASGGQCVDMQLTLTFKAPTVAQEYGPINSGQVPLKLTVERADGGAFSRPVPFALSKDGAIRLTGALDKSDSAWQATADAGTDNGPRDLFAGWDGGPHALGAFEVTATPPTITLEPDTAPKRPSNQTDVDGKPRWKKSEVATVRLVSDRNLLAAPTSADFDNASAVTRATTCTAEACVAPKCYCFAVDLAQLPFTQADPGTLHGTVPVSLKSSLTDVLGNGGTAEPAAFDVTRLKWSQAVTSLAAATPTALAITPSGVVVAGATAGTTSTLTALNPDGGIAWQNTYGTEAITAGPIVGTAVYFAVSNGSQGQLRKLSFDGSGPTDKCLVPGFTYPGDIALASLGANEFLMAVGRETSGTNASLVSSAPSPACGWTTTFFTKLTTAAARPTLVVDGTQAYVAVSNDAPVWKFGSLSTTPTPQGSRTTATLYPSNLFVAGANVVGGGGRGGPTEGGVFALYDDGGALDGGFAVNATPGTSPGGAAVVGPPGEGDTRPWVVYGDSAGNMRKARIALDNPPAFESLPDPLVIGGADFSSTAPLLGANDRIYSASANVLYVLGAAGPSEEWHWTAPDAISAQLNLDMNRDSTHPCTLGQPGVLYVVTAGTQTTVHAILVDSPGIEPSAPWPRYQHDPGNTGNSGTSLALWACP